MNERIRIRYREIAVIEGEIYLYIHILISLMAYSMLSKQSPNWWHKFLDTAVIVHMYIHTGCWGRYRDCVDNLIDYQNRNLCNCSRRQCRSL